MNWREARETTGRTLDDVFHEWRNRAMPDVIKVELSRAKLARLETGKPVRLSVFAMAHLADLLGARLSEIDPAAAEDYRALTTQEALISTWNTLFPDIARVA